MTPQSFTFKLSVPNDPAGADVVAAMAAHAATYASIDAAQGAAFVERVRRVARQLLTGSFSTHCQVVFSAADGQLTVTMGGQAVSEALTS
ncbi:MAG TPA: hypothetical protein VEC39_20785 [Vicinamibacterales bacterium]|nr:hypothetical protein [Vicinamibacterales bacterium]